MPDMSCVWSGCDKIRRDGEWHRSSNTNLWRDLQLCGEEEFRRQLEARQAVFIRQAFTLTKPDQLNGSASWSPWFCGFGCRYHITSGKGWRNLYTRVWIVWWWKKWDLQSGVCCLTGQHDLWIQSSTMNWQTEPAREPLALRSGARGDQSRPWVYSSPFRSDLGRLFWCGVSWEGIPDDAPHLPLDAELRRDLQSGTRCLTCNPSLQTWLVKPEFHHGKRYLEMRSGVSSGSIYKL